MPYRKNIVGGAILLIFSTAAIVLSFSITTFRGIGASPIGSAFVPRLWAICLGLLSLNLLVRGIRDRIAFVKTGKAEPLAFNLRAFYKKHYRIILTFFSIAAYTALISYVGFLLLSAIYLFAQIMILTPSGKRNYLLAGIVSIVTSVLLYFVFVSLLHLLLPRGLLAF